MFFNYSAGGRGFRISIEIMVLAILLLTNGASAVTWTMDDSSGADYARINNAINALSSGKITNDTYSDQEPVIIQRSNGELFVAFNTGGGDRNTGIYSSISIDNGKNWSASNFAVNGWDDLGLIEDTNGKLILLVNDREIYSWISSDSGQTWSNKQKVTPTSINYAAGSIIQAQDGYYYVSYSTSYPGDVYITRSSDLITWQNPIQVSHGNYAEFDSSLLQTSDGNFYIAYNSYTDNAIVIAVSNDGQTWNTTHKIPTSVNAHMGINLIEVEGKPVIFYASLNNLFYSFLNGTTWALPQQIFTPSPFGVDAVILEDGSVGIAYTNEVNSQRDIFFANLGKLNISPGAPVIISFNPSSTVIDNVGAIRTFNITASQTVDVIWLINGTQVLFNESVTETQYTNTGAAQGTWNVTAVASNANGTVIQTWVWTVNPVPIAGSISGFNINATNGNGRWDVGNGISNWTIRLIGITGTRKDTKVIRKETSTDTMGFYKFDNLPAGRYIIFKKMEKGFVPTGSAVKRINLAQNENSMNNNFTNMPVHRMHNIGNHGKGDNIKKSMDDNLEIDH